VLSTASLHPSAAGWATALDRAAVTDPDRREISTIRRSIDVEERVAASSS
jgi:hypothetical protein